MTKDKFIELVDKDNSNSKAIHYLQANGILIGEPQITRIPTPYDDKITCLVALIDTTYLVFENIIATVRQNYFTKENMVVYTLPEE